MIPAINMRQVKLHSLFRAAKSKPIPPIPHKPGVPPDLPTYSTPQVSVAFK